MKRSDFPAPKEGFVITHFITVTDVKRSVEFYSRVFDGDILMDTGPGMVKIGPHWIIVNTGGGPTDDKPEYYLEAPSPNTRTFFSFLNIRVADINKAYLEWSERGAEFLTEPKDRGGEIRCYMRDPDGYLIEVGEATGMLEILDED